VLDKC
jgi:hypothetical protein